MRSHRLLLGTIAAVSLSGAAIFSLPSCYEDIFAGGDCPPGTSEECCPCPIPEACPDGSPPIPQHCFPEAGTGDAGSDGDGSSALFCPSGMCAPMNAEGWEGPVLVYDGAEIGAPPCPDSAPILVFEGHEEPAPPPCQTCSCDDPTGSCSLPTTWTVRSEACNGGGVNTNFDPPTNWGGSCTANTSILPGKTCGGGPCVRSIEVSAPVLEQQPCTPHAIVEAFDPPPRLRAENPFDAFGRACTRMPWPSCDDPTSVCTAGAPGFGACVYRSGDEPCPEGWPVRHLFYGEVKDERYCTECACSAPAGGDCSVYVAVYTDTNCATAIGSTTVKASEPAKCVDLPSGAGLAGKTAAQVSYAPGKCMPEGGEVAGELLLLDARTFCCREGSTT